jgi:hypothetical protein
VLGLGGPVWHASGNGGKVNLSRRIARQALAGVGDARLGEWEEIGTREIVHVRRRLSVEEQEVFGLPTARDIRGSEEERSRLSALLAAAPYLAGAFA